MPERSFYGWKLLSVLRVIAFVNLAFPNYGASVINTVMAQEMKLDRQTLGAIVLFTLKPPVRGRI